MTTTLLTFPHAALTHHLPHQTFPLSAGPCSLIEITDDTSTLLALSIPPNTTVPLGKENPIRKTDQNESHASYSFNFSPGPAVSSSSTKGDLLPTSNEQGGGFLKLSLPQSKNNDEYEDTTALARKFESILVDHHLLDTRLPVELSEDAQENVSAVLHSWWTGGLAGVKETAGSLFSGAKELVAAKTSTGSAPSEPSVPADQAV